MNIMLNRYVKIPVEVTFFEEEEMPTDNYKTVVPKKLTQSSVLETHRSLAASIRQNLDLIFMTQEGELYFDKFFGLELWNHNFESKKLKHDEKKKIEQEIVRVIDSYEDRLKKGNHRVEVYFSDETKLIDGQKADIHVLTIDINSVLNEEFKSKENYFQHIFRVPVKIYYKT